MWQGGQPTAVNLREGCCWAATGTRAVASCHPGRREVALEGPLERVPPVQPQNPARAPGEEQVAQAGRLPVREGSSPSRRPAMWTAESRALVGDFGAGQALSDEQYALLAPLIPPAKPGGRPRTTDMRRMLDGLFYLVRTGCQ